MASRAAELDISNTHYGALYHNYLHYQQQLLHTKGLFPLHKATAYEGPSLLATGESWGCLDRQISPYVPHPHQ